MNKKKYFTVSDIHGHAGVLKKALLDAGFDESSPEHILVVCGDCFDRGRENLEVFEYLSKIQNKVIIRGNHEDLLCDAIKDGCIGYHDVVNGTDITVSQLFGDENVDKNGKIDFKSADKERINDFLSKAVDYYETENYIFVHGWVPTDDTGVWKKVWRTAPLSFWEEARYGDWRKMLSMKRILPDKTIICGHRTAALAYEFDPNRSEDDFSPFYADGMIAIDTLTVQSGRINVLVIDDP